MNKGLRWALGCIAVTVLTTALWFLGKGVASETRSRENPPEMQHLGPAQPETELPSSKNLSAAAQKTPQQVPAMAERPKIFSQRELYPVLMRMRDARSPGSWASGIRLLQICLEADAKVKSSNPEVFTGGPITEEVRLSAKRKLEDRCFNNQLGIYLNQYEPMLDDDNAAKYKSAQSFLLSREFSDAKKVTEAFRELARQHKLEEAAPLLKLAKSWNGERWAADPGEFSQMVNAAVEVATAEWGSEHDDIRLISKCYFNGQCNYQYGTIAEASTPAETERRKRIVYEMAQAMQNGDVERLLGLKQ